MSLSLKEVCDEASALTAPIPDTLYHYTRLSSLDYLLPREKGPAKWEPFSFQATSARFMNDPEEFLFGRRAYARFFQNATSIPTVVWRKVAAALSQTENDQSGYNGYFVCFSELGDDLSQWRAYGDDGFGVAVGYSRKYLEASTTGAILAPVLYGDRGKRTQPNTIIGAPRVNIQTQNKFLGAIQNKIAPAKNIKWPRTSYEATAVQNAITILAGIVNGKKVGSQTVEDVTQTLRLVEPAVDLQVEGEVLRIVRELFPAFLVLKDDDFAAEKEYRLIATGDPSGVRIVERQAKPYIEIGFGKPLLPQIIRLGPQVSQDSIYAVRQLVNLRTNSLGSVEIEPSDISYRPV